MNAKDFAMEWEKTQKQSRLSDIKEYWELRANEFNEHVTSNYDDIVSFLEKRGIVLNSYDVLDIGCGPGKLSVRMSSQVNSITGIDISENMISHAYENAKLRKSNNSYFKVASWEELNLEKESWTKKFDLVIASMTPGIHNLATLNKMIHASKKYCFISSYVRRRDLRNEIEEHLNEKIKDDSNSKVYYMFNILWQLGYYPEIIYKDTTVTNEYTYEKALEIYVTQFLAEGERRRKIEEYLQKKRNNKGMVVQEYHAKIAWMIFEI